VSVLYLVPTPPPVYPETEAYRQEIEALRARTGGRLVYINANRFLPRGCPFQIPRPFFGLLELPWLLATRGSSRLVQIYSPTLYPYPVLRALGRPVIYNLTGGSLPDSVDSGFFRRLGVVTVASDVLAERLRSLGDFPVRTVKPGVDTSRFAPTKLPLEGDLHVLLASAPWTLEQFQVKGLDALLEVVAQDQRLRLTVLFRGMLFSEMVSRVRHAGVEDRVRVLDGPEDVSDILMGVHATVNLATTADVVKAYPHSLMESLAAGKPVVVSRAIPMSSYVEEQGVGTVVEEVSVSHLLTALDQLRQGYREAALKAAEVGQKDFELEGLVSSFQAVHRELLEREDEP
jgi:glycosyltransferase involved in cell wall biosynthesis